MVRGFSRNGGQLSHVDFNIENLLKTSEDDLVTGLWYRTELCTLPQSLSIERKTKAEQNLSRNGSKTFQEGFKRVTYDKIRKKK